MSNRKLKPKVCKAKTVFTMSPREMDVYLMRMYNTSCLSDVSVRGKHPTLYVHSGIHKAQFYYVKQSNELFHIESLLRTPESCKCPICGRRAAIMRHTPYNPGHTVLVTTRPLYANVNKVVVVHKKCMPAIWSFHEARIAAFENMTELKELSAHETGRLALAHKQLRKILSKIRCASTR